jgi:RNA polymerase sigma-70 factor, ECF subfamily
MTPWAALILVGMGLLPHSAIAGNSYGSIKPIKPLTVILLPLKTQPPSGAIRPGALFHTAGHDFALPIAVLPTIPVAAPQYHAPVMSEKQTAEPSALASLEAVSAMDAPVQAFDNSAALASPVGDQPPAPPVLPVGRRVRKNPYAKGVGAPNIWTLETELEIILRAKHGDQAAFAAIYGQYHRLVRTIVKSRIKDVQEREDVVQQVFLRVQKTIHLIHEGVSMKPWINGTADALARRAYNDNRRKKSANLSDVVLAIHPGYQEQSEMDKSEEAATRSRDVQAALAQLPETFRDALTLYYFDGLPLSEIAHRLGQSQVAIRARVAEGITKMGSILRLQAEKAEGSRKSRSLSSAPNNAARERPKEILGAH